MYSVAIYLLTVTHLKKLVYGYEEDGARGVLGSVYKFMEMEYKSIEAHRAAMVAAW